MVVLLPSVVVLFRTGARGLSLGRPGGAIVS